MGCEHLQTFVKTEEFYNTCVAAKTFGSRPSQLLNIKDEYIAYCVDTAGAFLINKEKPNYKKIRQISGNNRGEDVERGINRNESALKALIAFGAQVDI